MMTIILERKLLDEKQWWEATSDHLNEQASMDSQSQYMSRLAQQKLVAIERALRRLATGTFERCDACGAAIEPERLEILLDSDCHVCATCATISKVRYNSKFVHSTAPTTYRHVAAGMAMA